MCSVKRTQQSEIKYINKHNMTHFVADLYHLKVIDLNFL